MASVIEIALYGVVRNCQDQTLTVRRWTELARSCEKAVQRRTRNGPDNKKPNHVGWAKCLIPLEYVVGRHRFELWTYGLRVRCSTS